MKENELFKEIRNIVRHANGLAEALAGVQALFASQYGAALLFIRPASSGSAIPLAPTVYAFLESRQFPFRGFYTAPLNSGNRASGSLAACIGTTLTHDWGAPADLLPRITNFAGAQFAELADRLALPGLEYVEAA